MTTIREFTPPAPAGQPATDFSVGTWLRRVDGESPVRADTDFYLRVLTGEGTGHVINVVTGCLLSPDFLGACNYRFVPATLPITIEE